MRTVHFGASVKNLSWVMCESSEMSAVLLAGHDLRVFAFRDIIDLNGVVFASRYNKLALVVVVERSDV